MPEEIRFFEKSNVKDRFSLSAELGRTFHKKKPVFRT